MLGMCRPSRPCLSWADTPLCDPKPAVQVPSAPWPGAATLRCWPWRSRAACSCGSAATGTGTASGSAAGAATAHAARAGTLASLAACISLWTASCTRCVLCCMGLYPSRLGPAFSVLQSWLEQCTSALQAVWLRSWARPTCCQRESRRCKSWAVLRRDGMHERSIGSRGTSLSLALPKSPARSPQQAPVWRSWTSRTLRWSAPAAQLPWWMAPACCLRLWGTPSCRRPWRLLRWPPARLSLAQA